MTIADLWAAKLATEGNETDDEFFANVLEEAITAAVRRSIPLPASVRLAFVGKSLIAAADAAPPPPVDDHLLPDAPIDARVLTNELRALAEEITVAVNMARDLPGVRATRLRLCTLLRTCTLRR